MTTVGFEPTAFRIGELGKIVTLFMESKKVHELIYPPREQCYRNLYQTYLL